MTPTQFHQARRWSDEWRHLMRLQPFLPNLSTQRACQTTQFWCLPWAWERHRMVTWLALGTNSHRTVPTWAIFRKADVPAEDTGTRKFWAPDYNIRGMRYVWAPAEVRGGVSYAWTHLSIHKQMHAAHSIGGCSGRAVLLMASLALPNKLSN